MRRSATKGRKSKSTGDNDVNDKEELGSKSGEAVAVSGDENSDDDNLSLQVQKNKRGKKGENNIQKSNADGDSDVSDAKKRKKNTVSEKEIEEEYEVEEVVDSKIVRGARQFKIHWKGFGPESDTWEPEKDLSCPELIQAFLDKHPNATTKDTKTTKKAGKSGSRDKAKKKKNEEDEEDGESEETVYEVEEVVDSKVYRGTRQFKIRWKGFGSESDTWEPEKDLNCSELIQAYLDKHPDANNKNAKGGGKAGSQDKPKKKKGSEGDEENEETVYEVEKVMEVHFKKNGHREFLIHWKGFSHSDDTWEPEANLSCPELIEKFMSKEDKVKAKPSSVKDVKATPQNKAQRGRRPSRRSDVK